MDEKNYIDLPESIDQNIPQTYKFDSALKPQRIIRLYQTSNDPNISKNKDIFFIELPPLYKK